MNTTTANTPNTGSLRGKLGTWLMVLATAALAFVMFVEIINILFTTRSAMRSFYSSWRAACRM